ncbi:sigma-70 family RNA polymerase sigma factor [Streptomyces hyaluromycini]|uniref:Sigma-70 family RNA polymerase sigma factor n=1 Tax=Streptomyces hyaluromycini TaxID=1377993 RepID=A0ABV1WR43_9ACTN
MAANSSREAAAAGTARADDATLMRAARSGEAAALAELLERHRAGMRAVALSLLGSGPDVEDVLQDAALTALQRIGDVRDPAAVGAWLRTVVRNASRAVLRERVPVRPVDEVDLPSPEAGPEQWLERHAARDWLWEALDRLSPALRTPLVLRYLTPTVASYEQVAAACGVPVGTVRSRLSQGRVKLALALAATADAPHADAGRRVRACRSDLARRRGAERVPVRLRGDADRRVQVLPQ